MVRSGGEEVFTIGAAKIEHEQLRLHNAVFFPDQ